MLLRLIQITKNYFLQKNNKPILGRWQIENCKKLIDKMIDVIKIHVKQNISDHEYIKQFFTKYAKI